MGQKFRIGTAGWSIPRDAAESFPGTGSHLERYARRLPCAEINSSFYRPPRASTWKKWADSVPEGFRFAVKAPKAITHEAALACPPEALAEFVQAASLLGEKLGPLLFQLPPKLAFDAARAEAFFRHLRQVHAGPVALEPRHPSWFEPEVDATLSHFKIAQVAADPARVPKAGIPGGWPGLVYFRLHGSPRTYYSRYEPFLQDLAAKLEQNNAANELWVIFDNTASGAAIHNALEFSQRIRAVS
jgi:uncharacterized protein YecE (DUF72 family)